MKPAVLIAVGGGVLAVGAAGYFAWDAMYLKPVAEQRSRLASLETSVESYDRALRAVSSQRERADALGRATLGNTAQEVEHRLRTLLTALGEQVGLRGVTITHGRSQSPESPAADRSSKLNAQVRRVLGSQTDFFLIAGSMQGIGTYEQVLSAAELVQSQPWVHRVSGMSIKPEGRERQAFSVRIDLATAYAPGLRPDDAGEPVIAEMSPERAARVRVLAGANPFVPPAPVVEPPPPPPPPVVKKDEPPPPPPPPPYDQWKVTGVIELGGGSVEVFVQRADGKRRQTVRPGDSVLDLVLDSVRAGAAVFRDGETLVAVEVGQTLAERRGLAE